MKIRPTALPLALALTSAWLTVAAVPHARAQPAPGRTAVSSDTTQHVALTQADDGTVVSVRGGTEISVDLVAAAPGCRWSLPLPSAEGVLRITTASMEHDGDALVSYTAVAAGTTKLTASERLSPMGFFIPFAVTIVVTS